MDSTRDSGTIPPEHSGRPRSGPGDGADTGKSARFFEAVVRQSAVAVIVTDLAHNVRAWSAGAERLLGYRHDEIVDKPLRMIVPDDLIEKDEGDG